VLGVGIGSAGPIDVPAGTVSPVNIPVWRDFPLVTSLRSAIGTDLVTMHGDGIAFAHAEHRYGAGRGAADILGLVVSTGIGGGLVLDGRVYTGPSTNAGYFGHTVILADGDACACGRRGCVEAYASGPQMVRQALAAGWTPGPNRDFIELADSARSGDAIAARAIGEGARALAVGIVNVLATLDIRRVVVGGGVSRAGEVYWEPLQRYMQQELAPIAFLTGVQVLPAELGGNAGILGAALAVMP
jgi:glucokinase